MSPYLLSIIIPVYNEEKSLDHLFRKLFPTIERYNYEIVFIDDGSKDNTAARIKKEIEKNNHIKLVSFLRNFGHQMALTAGYQSVKGDCIISLDADLQDPPEIIPTMIDKWEKGAKIVYAKREERKVDSFFKKLTAGFFYRFINFLSDTPIPDNVGDFRLLDKEVVSFLNRLPEKSRFIRGLVAWGGFPTAYVFYNREKRVAGNTHYTLSKMINFALEGITSFSVKPLRMATYLGFVSGIVGFLGILYAIISKILNPSHYVIGWNGLFIGIMFIGGIQLITIGIIGEYIGKIYQEVQRRPSYLIKEKVNFSDVN